MKTETKNRPYAWVPSLYFAEALPYMAVMTLSVIMYTKLGLSNTDLALYTGWLYLPWVIKPLWSPIVDSLRTKRWWIISMQLLVGASLGAVALTLQDKALVDHRHAAAGGCCACSRSLDAANRLVAEGQPGLLLADGLQ